MSNIRKYPLPWTTVYVTSTSPVFLPATPWLMSSEVDKVRATFELQGRTNDLEVAPGYQVADVENSLGTNAPIESYSNSNGMAYPSSGFTSLSATTEGKQLIRFGWMVKNTATSAISLGRVAGVVEVVVC